MEQLIVTSSPHRIAIKDLRNAFYWLFGHRILASLEWSDRHTCTSNWLRMQTAAFRFIDFIALFVWERNCFSSSCTTRIKIKLISLMRSTIVLGTIQMHNWRTFHGSSAYFIRLTLFHRLFWRKKENTRKDKGFCGRRTATNSVWMRMKATNSFKG